MSILQGWPRSDRRLRKGNKRANAVGRHMKLGIDNLGPIRHATIAFGDLTVLVGPQATGKSITLQLLKLLVDTGFVQAELRRYGLDWSGDVAQLLEVYFGEGMHRIWKPGATRMTWSGKDVDLAAIARRKRPDEKELLFLIPAQRVLALRDGWPRPFSDYAAGDPFAVREFSETLRRLLETGFTKISLFPEKRRLKDAFRKLLIRHIFGDFELRIDRVRAQRRLVLGPSDGNEALPQMVWSAGQREFVPLLLGLYWLMPPTKVSRRAELQWVVIEELEMGLHPRAIAAVLLMVLDLLRRGYRVCLSTHSPQVLEMVWALRNLRDSGAPADALLRVLGVGANGTLRNVATSAMASQICVYYYDRDSGEVEDISRLDPPAQSAFEANWGGLTEFSERANAEVAAAAANNR